MGKAIINKHIDSTQSVQDDVKSIFHPGTEENDFDKRKGEFVICNDADSPGIYIINTNDEPVKIAGGGGGSGEAYDDTAVRNLIANNTKAIQELQDNGVGATLPNKIVVAGLDDKFGSGYYKNGMEIDAGTNIYEVLQNILCQEAYPTSVTSKSASATVEMNNLTLTLSVNGIVEVGTLVQLVEGKTNGATPKPVSSQITGMTYGYSTSNDNTKDSSNSSITKECSVELYDNLYTISATIDEGFNANEQITVPETKEGQEVASLDATDIGCVIEGNNKITVNATGPKYSYEAEKIDKVYYCSNLGNTDSSKYHNGVDAVNGITSEISKSANASVTGAYYYFMGYSTNTSVDQFDSNAIRELTDKVSGWINQNEDTVIVPKDTIVTSNGQSIVIACPEHYELKTINYSNNADMMSKFNSGIVPVNTGEIVTNYKVYIYSITNNTQVHFTNVSLGKA
jgi:hypothetical protein